MHVIASFLYILMWKVLWMEIRIVLVWFPYSKSVKNKWKDRQIDIRLQLLMHNKIWKNVFPCIVWMWVYFSLYLVVNGYRWPTLGSLELEQSCAGSPLVTDVRRCPGRPHLSPSRSPSSPRLLSAHYGSVCSMSSPGLTCRWSHHCWNLAENGREGDDWLIDWLFKQSNIYFDNQLILQVILQGKSHKINFFLLLKCECLLVFFVFYDIETIKYLCLLD